MSQDAWEILCDVLDKELVTARKGQLCLILTPLALFLVSALLIALSFSSRSLLAFIVLPVLWVVTIGGLVLYTRNLGSRIKGNLQHFCEEESRKYSDLSFHIKEIVHRTYDRNPTDGSGTRTTWYLEIQIGPPTARIFGVEQQIPMAIASAPVEPIISPAERLEQLDKMKKHLTTEEYERKRWEILDSVELHLCIEDTGQ
jgi:hypothetical protein